VAVPYVSLEAQLLDQFAAHLAAGPAVQSFLGVAAGDVAAARALIVEIDGPPPAVAHLILAQPRIRYTRTPGNAFTGIGQLAVLMCAPVDATHTDAEAQRAALNWYGPMYLWCCRTPRLRDIDGQSPVALDVSDGLPGWMIAGADLSVDAVARLP
jgi:hypothetical protein